MTVNKTYGVCLIEVTYKDGMWPIILENMIIDSYLSKEVKIYSNPRVDLC